MIMSPLSKLIAKNLGDQFLNPDVSRIWCFMYYHGWIYMNPRSPDAGPGPVQALAHWANLGWELNCQLVPRSRVLLIDLALCNVLKETFISWPKIDQKKNIMTKKKKETFICIKMKKKIFYLIYLSILIHHMLCHAWTGFFFCYIHYF